MSELTGWLKDRLSGDPRSVREIADEIGVSHTTLGNWLKGTRPSWGHCNLIATFFGVRDGTIRRMAGYTDIEEWEVGPIQRATLTPDEEAIVLAYRSASEEGRTALLGVARVVSATADETAAADSEEIPPRPANRGRSA